MDLQPRAPEYRSRRLHADAETCTGRIAPLLASSKKWGGLPLDELIEVSRVSIEVQNVLASGLGTMRERS